MTQTASAEPRRAAVAFILVTLFLDVLGIGIIIPILPQLIKDFAGGTTSAAASWVGAISATYAVVQFVCAPILGALSDRFGRRPVILASLFGLGIDYIIMGFAPSLRWLFVGRVIAGIMGASFTTANAYIADISTAETRARNFGFVGVAFGLGFITGPALGGLLGGIDLRLPFFVSAGLCLVNWLYGFFVLPESLAPENRSPFTTSKLNPFSSIAALGKYPIVASLAGAFVCQGFAQRGLENVWVLYTSHRYGWGETANGLALALVGITAVIVQGGLVRPVIQRIGERRAILFGLGLGIFTYIAYGLASQGWMLIAVILFGAIGGVAGPAIQGLVAGSVAPNEQGRVQGALAALQSVTSILAPMIYTAGLFSYFT
ncbi:MAG: TCR/Tet family MFS transporter, partial [Acidobacteriota bacterium]